MSEAMRLAPGYPDVLYVQGVLCLKQCKWPEAQDALERATQIDQSYARAFAALGMALCDQGKYDAAIAPLEKSLQLDSNGTWETRWALANAYYKHEQYDEALKTSQEALASSNGSAPEIALLLRNLSPQSAATKTPPRSCTNFSAITAIARKRPRPDAGWIA